MIAQVSLDVLVQAVEHLALHAGGQVLHIELRAGPLAPHEGDLGPVRRRRRTHRSAGPGGHRAHLAGRQLVALDVEEVGVGILGVFEDRPGRDVAGVEDRLAVVGEGRLAQLLLQLLAGALDQGDAAAAGHVVEPDLAGPQRTAGGEVLFRRDEAAVGAPRRLVEEAEVLLGHLALVGPVDVHHPDVVAAAAVGGEGDALAVGREARLGLIGQPLGDPRRRPAGDRQGVDVAQQVEGDGPPVGADVEIHPGAFVDLDRDLANHRAGRGVDVPLGLGRRGRSLRLGLGHAENGDENRCEPECHEAPPLAASVANRIGCAMEARPAGRRRG